ncbi:hypothetical protein [Nitrosomonas communis]|uniref:Uncharacterized protein n=1 Tax=Nitrosomonas communis TaxID=44574 RepID=A0A1I4X447_9PROT|nr:hypothetical protein [Nitrosomonas communis]SFN20714.1 hypothetical protein SAMN05421863_11344 [Nitrosomonas communis]
MKFMKIFAGLILGALTSISFADPPYSIDRETGKYLGNLRTERYDPNSTSNPYGRPVIPYSPDSINIRMEGMAVNIRMTYTITLMLLIRRE